MIIFSVIIPIFNSEKALKECLDSILNSDIHDYELILVNDGSTDSSESICKSYAAENNNIIYKRQENRGVSAARNYGLKIANGRWIVFIDSDDLVSENYFSGIANTNADLVIKGFMKCDMEGVLFQNSRWNPSDYLYYDIKECINKYIGNHVFRGIACKFYRREILQELCFDEEIIVGEDSEFTMNFLARASSLAFMDDGVYIIRGTMTESDFQNKYMLSEEQATYTVQRIFCAYRRMKERHMCSVLPLLSYINTIKELVRPIEDGQSFGWFYKNRHIYFYLLCHLSLYYKAVVGYQFCKSLLSRK